MLLCWSEIFGWSTLFLITRKGTSRSRVVLLAASSLKHSQTRFIYDLICGNRFAASFHSRLWLLQQYLWSSSGSHIYWTSAARSSTMSHSAPLIIYSIYAEFSKHYSLAILQKAFHHHQQDSLKAFLYQWVTFFVFHLSVLLDHGNRTFQIVSWQSTVTQVDTGAGNFIPVISWFLLFFFGKIPRLLY